MNVPISSINSHLLVHIPTITSALLHAPSNSSDILICGTCKQCFFNVNNFIDHKFLCNAVQLQNPTAPTSIVNQNGISILTESTNTSNNEEVVPVLSPLFQVVVNRPEQNLPTLINSHENNISKTELLQSNIKDTSNKLDTNSNNPNQNNSSSLQTLPNENSTNNSIKRDFQINEDVAALLANQLSNEVCSLQEKSLATGAEALLQLSNLTKEIDLNESKDSCMITPTINLEISSNSLLPSTSQIPSESEKDHINIEELQDKQQLESPSQSPTNSPLPSTSQIPSESEKDHINIEELQDKQQLESPSQSPTNSSSPIVKKTAKIDSQQKAHKCNYDKCKFSTKYPKDLVRHKRTHTGEKPFKCHLCDTSFSRDDRLKFHIKTHFSEKQFKCKLCSYAAFEFGSLRTHLRTHTGLRPYK